MNRERRLAETFVELADTLVDDFDVIDFLQVLAARCVELLDVPAAGIMLAGQAGALMTVAASDERARLLELFEIQTDEGPCRDCYQLGAAVANVDLDGARQRWPQFAPQAITAGFRSANALPLRLRSQVIGSLNLFHADTGGLDSEELRTAQALADAATIGILQQRTIHRGEVVAGAAADGAQQPDRHRAGQRRPGRAAADQHRRLLRGAAHGRPVPQPAAVGACPRGRQRLRRCRAATGAGSNGGQRIPLSGQPGRTGCRAMRIAINLRGAVYQPAQLRKSAGLPQAQVAAAMGMSLAASPRSRTARSRDGRCPCLHRAPGGTLDVTANVADWSSQHQTSHWPVQCSGPVADCHQSGQVNLLQEAMAAHALHSLRDNQPSDVRTHRR